MRNRGSYPITYICHQVTLQTVLLQSIEDLNYASSSDFTFWCFKRSPSYTLLTGCLCSDLAVRCTSEELFSLADLSLWSKVDPKFPSNRSHDTFFPLQCLCSQVLLFIHHDYSFLIIVIIPILNFELNTLMTADYGGS